MRRPWFRRVCLASTLLSVLAVPLTGHAQVESREGIALQNQIYQLRQDLGVLRSQMGQTGGGSGVSGDTVAQLLTRVQALEEQVRQLRGRIDDTQNMISRQNADLSKRLDDLTFQLNLSGKGGAVTPLPSLPTSTPPPVREVAPRPAPEPQLQPQPRPAPPPQLSLQAPLPAVIQPPPPPPPGLTFNQTPEPMREIPPPPPVRVEAPKPTPPPAPTPKPPPQVAEVTPEPPAEVGTATPGPGGRRTPEMALQEGHAALARRDYAAAERAAREVTSNRTSPRAYDGQLLLAQALVGEKQFAQAAIAFDDAYNRSHKGRHAPDALVGLAGALTAINEKKAACDTLGRLRTEFPQVRADLQESITTTNQRAGCGR